jgi:hypothetical protein
MNRIRDNPTENFSQKADEDYGTYLYGLLPLAEADARIYFEEHKGINKDQTGLIGMAQALRHHVPSVDGHFYATYFFRALDDLLENWWTTSIKDKMRFSHTSRQSQIN